MHVHSLSELPLCSLRKAHTHTHTHVLCVQQNNLFEETNRLAGGLMPSMASCLAHQSQDVCMCLLVIHEHYHHVLAASPCYKPKPQSGTQYN